MEGRLAVTGLGMVASVGPGVVSACAAIRCGITRPAATRARAIDYAALEEVPVMGHPLRGLTDGFAGPALYIRIGQRAIRDLISYARLDAEDTQLWANTALFLCRSKAREEEGEILDAVLAAELPGEFISALRLPLAPEQTRVVASGHAAVLGAIRLAAKDIGRRDIQRAIVLGIDSLVGEGDLQALYGRLKSDENPQGLMPGEGGAAVLVEDPAAAAARGARIEAFLEPVQEAFESNRTLGGEVGSGAALAGCILATAGGGRQVKAAIGDLNGEPWRAAEWGGALSRIADCFDVTETRLFLPAESLGDTGAASGGVSLCAAVRSFVRGYAPDEWILVWSSSESGEVASTWVVST